VYQHLEYFAFGETFVEEHSNTHRTPYLFNGKELDEETGLYYYGARYYDAQTSVWLSVDPLVENHPGIAGYTFVANNPIVLIDPDGLDWFHYQAEGDENKSWHWHEGNTYNTGRKDGNGNDIILKGTEAVVIFRGSEDEKLGKGNNLYGEGAKVAEVMVLGPDGPDDVQFYDGYTMSSDPEKYGTVADGVYDANFDAVGKSGALKSNWAINGRGRVATRGNKNPNMPSQIDSEGNAYLLGIFIHRSNRDGGAGSPVSKGCLLILPGKSKANAEDWSRFNEQMSGVKNFKVEVNRSKPDRQPRFKQ
jgi:RHS repeat-associated protein